MAVAKTILERRVGVRAQPLQERDEAAELLVHAIAQLPNELQAIVPASPALRPRLELLARAYQVDQRLTFDEGIKDGLLEGLILDRRPIADVVELLSSPEDPPSSLRAHDGMFEGQRVAVVTNVPTHYRVPLFGAMGRRFSAAGAEFRAFFLSDVPVGREWMRSSSLEFEHEILKSVDIRRDRGRRLIPINLTGRLDDFRPTIVLVGGFSPLVAMRVAAYARRRDIPFGIWSGEIDSRAKAQSRVRRVQRKWIVDRAAFAVSYGWESAQYLRSLRSDLPIVIGRNTTPTGPERPRPSGPETLELLTVGRAEKGKALDVLLAAVSRVAGVSWRLTVIGDGPELDRLRRDADRRVRFLGARTPEEVRDAHSKADIFLFPSRYDIFGLVLVEAMGAGTAVVVSRAVGAVSDLAVDGVNAIVVDDHDPHRWAEAIERVGRDHDLRSTLGENAQSTIRRRWTIEHAANAMLAGLRLPLTGGASRAR
jgi:glycosyltransferase involved in cell wall biosynthesis